MRRFALPVALLLTARVVLSPAVARAEADSSVAETESTWYTTVSAGLLVGVSAVVTVVVLIVVLAQKDQFPRATDPVGWAPADVGGGLVVQGMYGGAGALATQLAGLVESPAAMDAFTREAALGGGPRLDALARAAGVPTDEVARQWLAATAAPAATQAEALAAVVRFVEAVGPRMTPDAERAAQLLDALAGEAAHPDRARPAHAAVAAWTGLAEAEVAPVVAEVLAATGGDTLPTAGGARATDAVESARAARHAGALEGVRTLGERLGERYPEGVTARAQAVFAEATALGVHVDGLAAR